MSTNPMAWDGGVNPKVAENQQAQDCLLPMGACVYCCDVRRRPWMLVCRGQWLCPRMECKAVCGVRGCLLGTSAWLLWLGSRLLNRSHGLWDLLSLLWALQQHQQCGSQMHARGAKPWWLASPRHDWMLLRESTAWWTTWGPLRLTWNSCAGRLGAGGVCRRSMRTLWWWVGRAGRQAVVWMRWPGRALGRMGPRAGRDWWRVRGGMRLLWRRVFLVGGGVWRQASGAWVSALRLVSRAQA